MNVLLHYGRFVDAEEMYVKFSGLRREIGIIRPWFGAFKEPDKVPETTWKRLLEEVLPHTVDNFCEDKAEIYGETMKLHELYKRYEEGLWEWIKDTRTTPIWY